MGEQAARIESYRDLRVWQEAMDVAADVYRLTLAAPSVWRHALAAQAVRAATSIPANIAEGYGRESTGSYLQFLKVARGSQEELETHILLAQRVGAASMEQSQVILQKLERVSRMLNALIRSIQASRR